MFNCLYLIFVHFLEKYLMDDPMLICLVLDERELKL